MWNDIDNQDDDRDPSIHKMFYLTFSMEDNATLY